MYEPLRNLTPDGLYLPIIKEHSIEKIRLHNYYVQTFAGAMKERWPQRAYLGLFSGAGRASVATTGEIIETTALSAFRVPVPFTKYIFVDKDSACTEALAKRIDALPGNHDVTILNGEVNALLPDIRRAMPQYGPNNGLLSCCFVDPFAANLRFSTLRALSAYKMDFLILLMLGVDARLNFRRYLEDETDDRIGNLINDPNWREEYRESGDQHVIRFILRKFDEAMVSLGYRSADLSDVHSVKIPKKNVFLYSLVFYSKHELGGTFWKAARAGTDPQLGFGL
jgi:three-Cys-motif partner protein